MGPVFLQRNAANTLEWAHSSDHCFRHACLGSLLLPEHASDDHKWSYHCCGTDGHEWANCCFQEKLLIASYGPIVLLKYTANGHELAGYFT